MYIMHRRHTFNFNRFKCSRCGLQQLFSDEAVQRCEPAFMNLEFLTGFRLL